MIKLKATLNTYIKQLSLLQNKQENLAKPAYQRMLIWLACENDNNSEEAQLYLFDYLLRENCYDKNGNIISSAFIRHYTPLVNRLYKRAHDDVTLEDARKEIKTQRKENIDSIYKNTRNSKTILGAIKHPIFLYFDEIVGDGNRYIIDTNFDFDRLRFISTQ